MLLLSLVISFCYSYIHHVSSKTYVLLQNLSNYLTFKLIVFYSLTYPFIQVISCLILKEMNVPSNHLTIIVPTHCTCPYKPCICIGSMLWTGSFISKNNSCMGRMHLMVGLTNTCDMWNAGSLSSR